MRTFPVLPPRRINFDVLRETLGHPLSVETRADGLAVRVLVQERYDHLTGPPTIPATTDDEIRAAIAAHDPTVESAAERAARIDREERETMRVIARNWTTATPLDKDRAARWLLKQMTR